MSKKTVPILIVPSPQGEKVYNSTSKKRNIIGAPHAGILTIELSNLDNINNNNNHHFIFR